jgi:hypothetical protein
MRSAANNFIHNQESDPAVSDPKHTTEGTPKALDERLLPRVEIDGIAHETDVEKINEVAFELYKEAWSIVNLAAHLLDEAANVKGGWPRNQAICAGLMIRITKFILVVTQLSSKGDRADVIHALNRSITESAINLEFLVRANEDKFFDQFVKFSLGPERELYDLVQANVAARGGEVWPIEQRMLESINDVCEISGVKIEEVNRKYGDWGGGVRERLKALGKEEQYVAMQRIPSHAVHETWVDLYKNHLEYLAQKDVFIPEPRFKFVDERLLGPIAIFVLEATKPYLHRYFPEAKLLLERIDDLLRRIFEADAVHERLMTKGK